MKANGEYLFDEQEVTIPGAAGVTAGSLELHVALYAPVVEGREVGLSQARATGRVVVRALDADDVEVGVSEVVEREGTYQQFTSLGRVVGDITLADVPIISTPSSNTMATLTTRSTAINVGVTYLLKMQFVLGWPLMRAASSRWRMMAGMRACASPR